MEFIEVLITTLITHIQQQTLDQIWDSSSLPRRIRTFRENMTKKFNRGPPGVVQKRRRDAALEMFTQAAIFIQKQIRGFLQRKNVNRMKWYANLNKIGPLLHSCQIHKHQAQRLRDIYYNHAVLVIQRWFRKQLEEMRKCDQIELFRRGAEQAELVTQSDFAVGFRMMMNQIIKTERQIGAAHEHIAMQDKQLSESRIDLRKTTEKLDETKKRNTEVERHNASLEQINSSLGSDLEDKKIKIAEKEEQLTTVQRENASLSTEKAKLTTDLDEKTKKCDEKTDEAATLTGIKTQLDTELQTERTRVATQNAIISGNDALFTTIIAHIKRDWSSEVIKPFKLQLNTFKTFFEKHLITGLKVLWTDEGRTLYKPENGYQAWTITEISPNDEEGDENEDDEVEDEEEEKEAEVEEEEKEAEVEEEKEDEESNSSSEDERTHRRKNPTKDTWKYKLSHKTDVIEVTDNAPGKTTKMFSVVHPIPVRQAQEIWNSFPIKNETIEEAMLTLSDVRKELYRTHIKKARQVASHYRNMHKNDRRATGTNALLDASLLCADLFTGGMTSKAINAVKAAKAAKTAANGSHSLFASDEGQAILAKDLLDETA